MLLKKILLFIFLVGISQYLIAQKPAWADYYKRTSMYPDTEFITGFISGINSEDNDVGEIKEIYETLAKDKLIQSIQVEIESNNQLNLSNSNGKSGEEFLSKSVSFSKANVSGLNIQSYYDRKKKEVYAFAFVNKKELAYYYYNIIKSGKEEVKQKLNEGRIYASKNDKEDALRSFYETMPIQNKMDEARVLLIALNRKMHAEINSEEINELKIDIINEINDLINPSKLDFSESAYFMAYGIFLQLGEITESLYIEDLSYENTDLKSHFSERWKKEFAQALVKAGKYDISNNKSGLNHMKVNGNYWTEGEFININITVSKREQVIAASKGSIPLSWFEKESIAYIPEEVVKMESLIGYRINILKAPISIKLGVASYANVEVQLTNDNSLTSNALGIPIIISNTEDTKPICNGFSDEKGEAKVYLPIIQSDKSMIQLEVDIDLAKYLDLDKNSLYLAMARSQNPIQTVLLDIKTNKPTIFIISDEQIQNSIMEIKTLEPVIKENLAEKGYNFVDNEKEADFIIIIRANTTTANQYQGLYFSYLDANFSIIDNSKSEEIYKVHLDQIKGGGGNYNKAAKKAYRIGAEKLKEYLKESPFNN